MTRVFLSYARADGEVQAAGIRERLSREAPDIEVFQDRLFLEGGIGWWRQITDAIDTVDFLILLATPAAIASGNVQNEWRYARQQGTCVYPVKAASATELSFSKMPGWMSKRHFFDLEKEWPSFVAHLRKACQTPRVPFMAPDLPTHFVARPLEYETLKNLLLNSDRSRSTPITASLVGAAGFGKTTLAAALCHDEDIVENFDGGILWVTLGQTPDLASSLLTAYSALTGERLSFAGPEHIAFRLGQILEQNNFLLIVDDVWDAEHLRPFLIGGKSSARLFTTRDASIAAEAVTVNVDEMSEGEALELLNGGVPGLGADPARELARRLGEWPLALELSAAMMRERIRLGDSPSHAAGRLLAIVERKGVKALRYPAIQPRHETISAVLEISLKLLDAADRRRFEELSIFPEDVAIPLAAAASVWGLDEFDAEDLARRLARLSLLRLDLQRGLLRLHDVMRSWLAGNLGSCAEVHNRLLDAWPDWRNLPEMPGEYAWRWLPWHLIQAGRDDLPRILWDPRWMQAKLRTTDVNALIADYEYLKPSAEIELLQGALRLSVPVLAEDARQLAGQMVGRLLPYRDSPAIRQFIAEVSAAAAEPWLRPLRPALHPPGTQLIRTLEGHSAYVYGVTMTPDGKWVVSASFDSAIKIWDIETGELLRTLEGGAAIYAVAVTPDGERVVSACMDHTLKVWNLQSGMLLRTLEGHSSSVYGVTVTPDGKRAVSASEDRTLKVWELETGAVLRTLEGHTAAVRGVAVAPDGRLAISASEDRTLKVWHLETGKMFRTLKGHSASVNGVAITPDGKRVVSASEDRTLKVWDVETGFVFRTLEGHAASVYGVAITADGKLAVSASWDTTLRVWDLASGRAADTLRGHYLYVSGVAICGDGKRVVSGSWDNTLKVWDLKAGPVLHTTEGHSAAVYGVAIIGNAKRAVSISADKTLKVWDLESGEALRTLRGHSDVAVALTPDGKQAVCASWNKTLKVWSLETGAELRTLDGHCAVHGVAVTPDGERAVSAGDKTLKMWDLETGTALRTMEGHSEGIGGVAITRDGKRAVSTSMDKTLRVWDLETGSMLRTLAGHTGWVTGVALTTDGKWAVSASYDHTLKLWDLETGATLRTLEGHSGSVIGVAVSEDGKRAVSASMDKTLRLWDLAAGAPLATFYCDAFTRCCVFVDGQTILAGDDGGRLIYLSL